MQGKLALWFALLSATTAMAAAQDFLLGVNYSELIPTDAYVPMPVSTGVDAQGDIYLLVVDAEAQPLTQVGYLIKLSPTGGRVVYRNTLAFQPSAMAVDPTGNVYLAGNNVVQKLAADGATVLYTTSIGQNLIMAGLAVDAAGRAYVTGWSNGSGFQTTPGALQQTPPGPDAFVVRLQPSGAVDYATYLGGGSQATTAGIAVDASGAAFVTGFAYQPASFPITPGAYLSASGISNSNGASFLAHLSPDGTTLDYSTFTDAQAYNARAVALDSAGNAAVLLSNAAATRSAVLRFNALGTALLFSKSLPASGAGGLAVDTAGNTYLASPARANFGVRNSLAPCDANGSSALTVLDGSGNLLQSTYIPGSLGFMGMPPVAGLGAGSTVYAVGTHSAAYSSTQGSLFLTSFSADANAQVEHLACLGNGGSYDSSGIAAGELISLFGQGLGPAAGAQPQVNAQMGFPRQLDGVQVTFNGTPGPLLYVQDGQINAIAPWSLQGGQTVDVCVLYNGAQTNCLAPPVVAADPGVFTVDGTYAAALNQDGSFNSASNPARVGSIVTVFATGLGAINPPQADGAIVGFPLPVDVLPVTLFEYQSDFLIGQIAVPVPVNYAGPAPYEVAGVTQINFTVQDSGPVYLDVGGQVVGALVSGATSAGFQIYVSQ
jgi:uncharacterized protein (TIGR03437 family)